MIYHVPVTRTESVTREFSVSADSLEEAIEKALQKAYDYEWPRGEADYTINDDPKTIVAVCH